MRQPVTTVPPLLGAILAVIACGPRSDGPSGRPLERPRPAFASFLPGVELASPGVLAPIRTRLVGTVVDSNGDPFGHQILKFVVEFGIDEPNATRWLRTELDGTFAIAPFDASPDLAEARWLRIDSGIHDWTRIRGSAELPVEEAPASGDRDIGLLVAETDATLLEGRVVDFESNPIAGAGVTESDPPDRRIPVRTRTDAEGRFRLPGWTRGRKVAVHVGARGYVSVSTGPIDVGTDDVVVELRESATISGRVLLPDGFDPHSVRIELDREGWGWEDYGVAEFRAEGLEPDEYSVHVWMGTPRTLVHKSDPIRVDYGKSIELDPIDLRETVVRVAVDVEGALESPEDTPLVVLDGPSYRAAPSYESEIFIRPGQELWILQDETTARFWSPGSRLRGVELAEGYNALTLQPGLPVDVAFGETLGPIEGARTNLRATGDLGVGSEWTERILSQQYAVVDGSDLRLRLPAAGEFDVLCTLTVGRGPNREERTYRERIEVREDALPVRVVLEESDRVP